MHEGSDLHKIKFKMSEDIEEEKPAEETFGSINLRKLTGGTLSLCDF